MRLPFLRPKSTADAAERARGRPDDPGQAQAARTRARQRLVGALVLLALGVVSFPLLFDTQPRPLSPDIPIAAPNDAGAPPPPRSTRPPAPLPVLPADAGAEGPATPASEAMAVPATPAPSAQSAPATVAAVPTVRDTAPASATAPAPANAPGNAPRNAPGNVPAPAPAAAVATAPATAPAAPALVSAVPPPGAPAPAASTPSVRFVVQVGAFAEARALRDARQKAEALGLKTYVQVIDNDGAKRTRVRVGPFDTRQEADAAAKTLKAGGLPAAVLTLAL